MTTLQNRQKWLTEKRNFQVSDIVLVKEEGLPRNKWRVARVINTHPSNDGMVRSVTVRLTPSGTELMRSINKLVLLIEKESIQD